MYRKSIKKFKKSIQKKKKNKNLTCIVSWKPSDEFVSKKRVIMVMRGQVK